MMSANLHQVGKSTLLPWQTLQQDFGLREKQAAGERSANLVSWIVFWFGFERGLRSVCLV